MTTLQPIIKRRLHEFRRRRNLLLTAKGISAAIIVAMVVGLLFATIDAKWALSNTARWMIAGTIYLAIAVTVGLLAIGPSLRGRSVAWLADMLEQLEPRVKNRLLAAIELSDDFSKAIPANKILMKSNGLIGTSVLDSSDFRAAVQRSAARRIESIDMAQILPWKLVRLWMWISSVILAAVALLCFVPDLHLGNRLGRILLPMANIGRVSKYAIEIIEPASAVHRLPEEQIISIQATVRGGIPSSVHLETESIDGQGREISPMHLDTTDTDQSTYQFHWSPPLGRTRYRVIAQDASTAWYTMDVRLRPKVESFKIEFRYPEYARQPNSIVESDSGNIKGLVGTVAIVSIFANQKIAKGEIRLQAIDGSLVSTERDSSIPLHHSNDGGMIVEIPIERDSTYHVDLVASETQFTNSYNPKYFVHATPDEPPVIRWLNPTDLSLAVQPDQLLELSIAVEDELPVAALVQQTRAGTVNWNESAVASNDLSKQTIKLAMDLSTLNVKPGERVQTRFVAKDRKGQSATSAILDLFVSSMSLDPNRQTQMRERVELVKEVEAFHKNMEAQAAPIQKMRNELKKQKDDVNLQDRLAESIQEFNDVARRESSQLRQKIAQALPKVDDSVSSTELELMAQAIARLETEGLPVLPLDAAREKNRSGNRTSNLLTLEQSGQQVDKFVKNSSHVATRGRDFVSHDVLSQVGQDLNVLLRYQQELKSSIGSILPDQYRRRQMLVARQMQDLSELIREQLPILRNRSERSANQWAQWLDEQALKILDVTGKEGKPKPVQNLLRDREQLAAQIEQGLQQHQNVGSIDNKLPNEQLQARRELHAQAGTASRTVEKLEQAVRQSTQPEKAAESEASITQQLLPSLEQLAMRRELQQARKNGDTQFVADLGEAYRATQTTIQARHDDPKSTATKLDGLNRSLKTLESIHDLNQASKTLKQLFTTERWQSSSLDGHFEQPRVWDEYQQQMTMAIQSLANAKAPPEIIRSLQALQQGEFVERINGKIRPRRTQTTATASAAQDIEELQTGLQVQIAALAEVAKAARATLAEQAPSVPDLARDAAKKVRSTSEDTRRLAQDVADEKIPEPKPRIEQLQQSIENNEPSLKQLREALADVASRQDLLKTSDARIASDADISVAKTHDIQKRIRESVEEIPTGSDMQATQQQLDQSASTQQQSAEALEQMANHFEALTQPLEPGKSSDLAATNAKSSEIGEATKEVARKPEIDRAHADAERLRRLASLDPKRVLEQLEKELVHNKPMQTELSDIAKEAVDDAVNTLDYTAEQENALRVELENSDIEFLRQKRQLQSDIDHVAKSARHIAESLSPRVQSTGDQAQSPDARKNVQRLRDDLKRIADATNALDSLASIEKIKESANELATGLDYFQRGMVRQGVALEIAAETPLALDNNQSRNRQKEMEDWQSRFQDEDVKQGFAEERSRQQETNQADAALKKVDKDIEQQKRQLENAERQLAKKKDKAHQEAVDKEKTQLNIAEEEKRWAQSKLDAAEDRQEAAKAAREKVQMNKLRPLNAANPSAQLSSRTAAAAAFAAQAAAESLQKSLGNSKWSEEPNAAVPKLNEATIDQEGLKQDIESAASALARAARHEQRLTHPENDAMIAKQADQVAAIASGNMQQAQDLLAAAAGQPSPSAPENQPHATSQATLQSQWSLKSAEQALREQADSLRSSSSKATASNEAGALTSNPSNTAKKNDSLFSPQEMARMLDELDQQLNSPPKEGEGQGTSSQKSAKSSAKSSKQSKSTAPGEPSDASADERGQTMADAAQRLASEMNQQRQAMESSAKAMPDTGAPDSQSRSETAPGKSSAGMVMPVEIENLEDWGKLRQQASENTLEGDREQIMPAYRRQIEEYFKVLSKRQR